MNPSAGLVTALNKMREMSVSSVTFFISTSLLSMLILTSANGVRQSLAQTIRLFKNHSSAFSNRLLTSQL
jgi:hypothetical protein